MARVVVSIDAMGGDFGPRVIVPAALLCLQNNPELHVIFVGKEDVLHSFLRKYRARRFADRWSVQHASEVVGMDESPASALRNKKDSAMRVAVNLVKEGRAEACVSAGNTGALMATARFVLKTLPGIDRPAITTQFPARNGKLVRVLDLGANVDSKAEHLYQFAVMGSMLATAVKGIESPTVGLLNVGEEEIKGNEQVKQVNDLLSQSKIINYIGYVEGNDLFTGEVDVIVCDGFVGNIVLKAVEGLAKMLSGFVRDAFKQSWYSRLMAFLAWPVLRNFKKTVDTREHNGATLLGLNGIVIKSHGGAGVIAFASAIEEALIEVEKNVLSEIRDKVAQALQENSDSCHTQES